MKARKLLLLLLFFTANSLASVPTSISLSAGPLTSGPSYGVSFSATTPYSRDGMAFSLQYGHLLFSALSGSQYQEFSFGIWTLSSLNRIIATEDYSLYFKSGAFFHDQNALSGQYGLGLHFALGIDIWKVSPFSLYGELGYSLPFMGNASKLQNQFYTQGTAMALGLRYYF